MSTMYNKVDYLSYQFVLPRHIKTQQSTKYVKTSFCYAYIPYYATSEAKNLFYTSVIFHTWKNSYCNNHNFIDVSLIVRFRA